ncbi:MAG: histidine phosphatase family protein [Patescibacteria group bacterium]|uniref:phosphoglycerate mutase (2,3-diphosphoglycerate-dependent) n=1 Tax=candidate division WWE3 bacterium TaxID=2053526 RepID=A0A955ECX9_UNCKA|nr:histidine phosphatase family protein [candidate division WWE3 bacterium]
MNIDPALYQKYSKEKVDDAVAYLSYKKDPQPLPKSEDPNYPILYVFRHGQTEDNKALVFSGWRDSPLSDAGKEQAKVLAEKLKDKNIHMLIASDQIRAVETMKIAMSLNKAKDLEIIKDPRIKERCYGDYQGKSKLDLQLENPEFLHDLRRSYDFVPPNGESVKMTVERVRNFLDEVLPHMKQNKINVAVSCHGNSIRGIRQYFENLTEEETAEIETPLAKDYAAYNIK